MTTSAGSHSDTTSRTRIARVTRAREAAVQHVLVLSSLYIGALLVRLLAIAGVRYPVNEGSAYYVAVAGNVMEGRGLVTDALWSFATPPLVVPRPAFELWQPMASFISATSMAVSGPGFLSAQLGHAVVGALAAPLCWAIARDAAQALGLDGRRSSTIAIGSGILAVILAPFLTATAAPDSTTPFLVLVLACCLLMPPALRGSRSAGLALGVMLGLAYLARLEAIYVALAFLILVGGRWSRLVPVVVGGVAVAVPWLIRNLLAFGTLFPGQALENLFFTRNEHVFAYLERPTAERFLAQGGEVILANIVTALRHNFVDVLLVPAAPIVVVGLPAALWLLPKPQVRRSPLGALLLSGGLTFVAITVLFPVATLWGTFEHAAGPLLAGMIVASAIGADALVARVRDFRRWPRSNAWLAPAALVATTLPITFLLVGGLPDLASARQAEVRTIAEAVTAQPDAPSRLVSDHPVWLAEETGIPSVALPDEPIDNVLQLMRSVDAPMVVLLEGRGRYPAELRQAEGARCFSERSLPPAAPPSAAIFVLREECR